MFSVEEKFPAIFDENDNFNPAGQLSTAVASPLTNKYDFKQGDVVLITLPESDDLWIELIEACITQKIYVMIPAHNRDAAFIAQTIREQQVSVLAISPVLWTSVFQRLNAQPEGITRMQVIISDGQGVPETRFSLLPDAFPRL